MTLRLEPTAFKRGYFSQVLKIIKETIAWPGITFKGQPLPF
jgi:hypothetical protein